MDIIRYYLLPNSAVYYDVLSIIRLLSSTYLLVRQLVFLQTSGSCSLIGKAAATIGRATPR